MSMRISIDFGGRQWRFEIPADEILSRMPRVSLDAPSQLTGVDIGSHSIKVVKLQPVDEGFELVNAELIMLHPETIIDGAMVDFDCVAGQLQKLLIALNGIAERTAISVSGHSTLIKRISLPRMTEAELRKAIKYEAEQYIPFDIKDVYVDVAILPPENPANAFSHGQMEICLVVAKKDVVDDYIRVVERAGGQCVVVDSTATALVNAFEHAYGFPKDENIVITNVGAGQMNIVIIKNGEILFTRDISMGADLVTEEIMKTLGLSWEDAEHYKTAKDEETNEPAIMREVRNLEDRCNHTLVTEIIRSLDFFCATTICSDFGKVYVCGGGASANFSTCLEARLRANKCPTAQIIPFNPFQNIRIDPQRPVSNLLDKMSARFAVAVGLALRRG
ncbi:type IV pilus assembly protein PilM [Candidatus Falkowbacteria bacterium]|nr:type IV pilus assembly protein PilM [Candidatus Falkowbacteria bacterium]